MNAKKSRNEKYLCLQLSLKCIKNSDAQKANITKC